MDAPPRPQPAGAAPRVRRAPWRTALEMLGLGPPAPDGARFHALISYSHATDARLATALQNGLARLARPWYRTRALHVFLDNASLSANPHPHLWRSVQAGLDDSQHLVLLASRDAARSAWVDRECGYWREHKPIGQLLIVLTDGAIAWDERAGDFDWTPTTAIPPALRGAFEGEPRWIDLRWAAAERDLTLANPRFRDAVVELGAPLHGIARDELDSNEVRERRRAVRLARAATGALAVLLVAAVVAAVLALEARDQAAREARVAQSRTLAVQARDEFGEGSLTIGLAHPDLGVLLALEAYRLAPTEQARGAVLDALEATDRTVGYLHSAGGPIESLTYSPDGRTIAVQTANHGVELWSSSPLRELGVLALPAGDIAVAIGQPTQLSFSPDGSLLALANVGQLGRSYGVAVWRVRTRTLIGTPIMLPPPTANSTPPSPPTAVAFAPNGALVIGALDGTVWLWKPAQPRVLDPLAAAGCSTQTEVVKVESLALSTTGTLAVGCANGVVLAWRSGQNASPERLPAPATPGAAAVAISADGGLVAAGFQTGAIATWRYSIPSGTYSALAITPASGDGAVQGVAVAPRTGYVAAAYPNGTARVYEPGGAASVWYYENTPVALHTVAWSRDGRILAVGGDDGLGVLWRAPRPDGVSPAPDLYASVDSRATRGGTVAFDPAERYLASVEPDGVRLWDPASGRAIGAALPGSAGAGLIAAGPDVLAAVVGAATLTVRRWDLADPRSVRPIGAPLAAGASSSSAIALDARARTAAVGVARADGRTGVELWDLRTGRERYAPTSEMVDSLAFEPGAAVLAVGESEGIVQTIRYGPTVPRARTLLPADASDGPVNSLAYGAGVLAESDSGIVRLLDPGSGRLIDTPVRSANDDEVAFSADGLLLAVADTRGHVQLLDAASGEPFGRSLPALGSRQALATSDANVITSVAFSPDGSLMAAGGSGPVTLWNRLLWTAAQYGQREQRLCALVGRNLTALEWRTFLPGEPYHRTCPRWPAGD